MQLLAAGNAGAVEDLDQDAGRGQARQAGEVDGGLGLAETTAERAVQTVLSGPAAGVIGGALLMSLCIAAIINVLIADTATVLAFMPFSKVSRATASSARMHTPAAPPAAAR